MKFNCDDATERLPWLLNGTLGDEEREAVREHLAECASCRRALAETRLTWETFDQHPPTEEIVALAWGETPNPALEEHLESCPRCTAELELARMSRHLEEDERIAPMPARRFQEATAPAVTKEGWRGWRNAALAASLAGVVGLTSGWLLHPDQQRAQNPEEQIAARPAPPVAVPGPSPTPPAGAEGSSSPSAEEAERARLLEQQRQELEALRAQEQELRTRVDQLASALPTAPQPQINPWTGNLRPSGDVVRSTQGEAAQTIPGGSPAVLYLDATHQETHSGHAVTIEDAAGKVVWRGEGLVRDEEADNYGIALPAGMLRPGDYTIRVYGLNGGQREPAETYAIRVRG